VIDFMATENMKATRVGKNRMVRQVAIRPKEAKAYGSQGAPMSGIGPGDK
jgi:hypothetical protein